MLGKIDSPRVRALVVWLPILKNDGEEAAALAAGSIKDARARHFFNPDSEIGRSAAKAMGIAKQLDTAWDVFLVYGPDVKWDDGPRGLPPPTAWMHHLSQQDPRWMTPEALSRAVRALLP